ncbi:retrotransposon protein, putative, ty1-copia subclass [Tanacetum coccineum]
MALSSRPYKQETHCKAATRWAFKVKSFEKCVSCISIQMAQKPFTHVGERANDLLGLIHSGVCGPSTTTSREGVNYYVPFTYDFTRYGYGYALESAARILNMVRTKKVDKTPSTRISQALKRYDFYVDVEEHELGDHGEPANRVAPKAFGSKWLIKKKTDVDDNVHTYKARLVAKGYDQTYEIDYKETFSPVAVIKAFRILLAISSFYDYEIWQMDVKTAFLNGSIYGLKQASRSWNKRFDEEIKKYGFTQNLDEPCVYILVGVSSFPNLIVDSIFLMGNNIPMLQDVKSWLGKCFSMKDLVEEAYILEIKDLPR